MIKMPLKLKVGRSSGRYELSEDIYILTIFVGETPTAQCTLTSGSTSADVFRYLREKHGLCQPEIFGLQYQMKATDTEKRMLRWIEPEKPIRKQLEKYACRRGQKWAVNLAILHACANVFTLYDYVSRNTYYELLKYEVLQSEKFSVDLDKAINLAAYQCQIDMPDIKPTVHHLKTLPLLPQSICRNPKYNIDEIYLRIQTSYEKLHTMQPAYATLLYIVEVQQCEGYGEEAFPCKDGTSLEEVSLGYSLDWIFVRKGNGTTQKFRWEEVREIAANKRKLAVKYGENGSTATFCFEDNELAHYVCTVFGWKWRHARTDAQQQRSARLSVQNLQCGGPGFSQPGSFLRRSNVNINSVRPCSEQNNNNYLGPYALLPPTPLLSATGRETNGGSQQSTVHSLQSCAVRPTSLQNSSSLSVCCRSVSMGQMPAPPPPPPLVAAFLRPSEKSSSPPSAAFYPPGAPQPTPSPHALMQQTSNSSHDSDWLRNEQREVLKRMLTHQQLRRMSKIGSSPEINTVGKSAAGGVAKCKRQQCAVAAAAAIAISSAVSSNNGSGGGGGGFTLARQIFTSTPNLHSARQQPNNHHQSQQTSPHCCPPAQQNGGTNGLPSPLVGHRLVLAHSHPLSPPFWSPHHHPAQVHPTSQQAGFLLPNGGLLNGPLQQQQQKITAQMSVPSSFFSQGQVVDENGQQRTVIYPVPAELAHQQQQSPPSPPSGAALSFPSHSPPVLFGLDENSRSSPKSNSGANSSHSEPVQMHSAGQATVSATEQQKSTTAAPLPEFAEIEFSGIPAKSLSADFSVAVRPHNLPRNRGSKIYPYNENRAKLATTKGNPDGYINASEIAVPLGKQTRLRYLVSQAPITKTIEDFWNMVWESGARLIVMLVNPHQINKDDNIPSYIPSQAKEKLTVGDFFLRLKTVSPPMQMQMFQSTTTFTLTKSRQRRTIFHLYCADFSEQGVPSSMDTFIGLIDAVASVKRHLENEAKREGGAVGKEQAQQTAVSKSNSNTSKESGSSSEVSNRERTQSAVETGGGWTKKLRFETANNGTGAQQRRISSPVSIKEEPLAIIQCTDGASESGLYLLAEVIIKCMEKNVPYEIAQLLRDLRYQRMCMVKNAHQYKFVYDLVSFYERKSRLI